ncbi:hypothetical protein ACKKBG_A07455 [Auxenochlorella protothecoides x Auxenochlorella symbiontica]
MSDRVIALPPDEATYTLRSAHVPVCCLERLRPEDLEGLQPCVDGLALVDITVNGSKILSITPAGGAARDQLPNGHAAAHQALPVPHVDLRGKMVLPTFVDLHTHIDKGHTCERSRNPDGSLTGADRSTAADAAFWDADDVRRRMEFGLASAHAHGTAALRTHLINMTPAQTALTWPVFSRLRAEWRGRVELQGVSLVALSFYRDAEAARALADLVAAHGGALGAAVCCAERGGDPADDWTTCDRDRGELLDRIFTLAKQRDLDLDFHTDENGNEAAKGLRYVAEKAIQHDYIGRVVCGHCCSLAYQSQADLDLTLDLVRRAGITIVSLPLVNQWTQDRRLGVTPRWRGVTLMHEIRVAGVPAALASDNTRDQFYAYGDLDMLEVFVQGCRMAHLDRPYEDWVRSVGSVPAQAMGLEGHGTLCPGSSADFVVFRGRCYSELMSRPQHDRLVVRAGRPIDARPPPYELLDDLNVPHEQRGAEAMVEKDVLVCASKPNGCSPAAPRHCKAPVLDRVRAYLPMVITLLVGVTLGAGTVGFAPRR